MSLRLPEDGSAPSPRAAEADEALMMKFVKGDEAAFVELVERHQRGVFNFLLRSVGRRARAEELLQEVFLRVVRSKARYQASARFTTWVYAIARNLTVDESRRARFRNHASLDAPGAGRQAPLIDRVPEAGVPTDAAAEAPALRQRIAAAVQALPEDQREVFLMRQLSGLSFREIAEAVGVPENTAKSRMRYALERLRDVLSDLR